MVEIRKGIWRGWALLMLFLSGTVVSAVRPDRALAGSDGATKPDSSVGFTIELNWMVVNPTPAEPADPAENVDGQSQVESGVELWLELSEGKILEATPWLPDGLGPAPGRAARQVPGKPGWVLGADLEGRIRARIDAPLNASLIATRGKQVVRLPVASFIEHPQQTPMDAPLRLGVERLAWDSLTVEIDHGEASAIGSTTKGAERSSGLVAPGSNVPVSVGYNILSTDTDSVTVKTSLTLRPVLGGSTVWKQERHDVVATNRFQAAKAWDLVAPKAEGVYILEVQTTWETPGAGVGREAASGRIGRLIRRHRGTNASHSAKRRVGLTVFDAKLSSPARPQPTAPGKETRIAAEVEVDSFDLSRIRGGRTTASGRSPKDSSRRSAWEIPASALVGTGLGRRDRLRAWIPNAATVDIGDLGPADPTGYAWASASMKVAHPDRPHRLTLSVADGNPASLSVAVIDPGGGGRRPHLLLDASASAPPIVPGGTAATFSWVVWPGTAEPTLIVANRDAESPVKVGTVRLTELEELPSAPFVFEPKSAPTRSLGLYLGGPEALDRFGGGRGETGIFDSLTATLHLASYLKSCGATDVVLSERLADRRSRGRLNGQALEDSTSPDRLDLILMVLHRHGCRVWLELDLESPSAFPGLPPVDSPEALERGLVRVDRQGQADGPAYHPLHDDVRSAIKRRVVEAVEKRIKYPALTGVLIRLGPGPTLLGTPDTGLDDATYERFVRDTFGAEVAKDIPGLGKSESNRFSERYRYLTGVGRVPWLAWRSRAIASLYAELSRSVRTASPGAVLAVTTPTLDDGPAGNEARRVDLAGLSPIQAWRSVGLDFQVWPEGPDAPIVVRAAGLSVDDLAHDLATSPDLDAKVASRQRRGMMLVLEDDFPPTPTSFEASLPPLPAAAEEVRPSPPAPNSGPIPFRPAKGKSHPESGSGLWLKALPLADGSAGDEAFGHALAAIDARWVFVSSNIVAGHEDRLRRFASVLRALPALPAEATPAALDPSRIGVSLRITRDEAQSYLAIANDTPYPIRVAATLDGIEAATPVDDLGRGLRLSPQADDAGGRMLVVDLLPFGVSVFRVGTPKTALRALTPYPSQAVLNAMQTRYKELSGQLARLNRSLSSSGLADLPSPGFEPDTEPQVRQTAQRNPEGPGATPALSEIGKVPIGWKVEGGKGTSAEIDGETVHSGSGSARLNAPNPPSSLVSDPFLPNTLSAVTIEAFFRSDVADAKVRVWFEGEAEGGPFIRRSELTVSQEWRPRAFRASDIPATGLDSARLRFEMLTPGTLWIDDVRVINEQASKSARLNAQRTLLSALQAYREQRYADFARLSSSHWTRHPGVLASIRPGRPVTAPNNETSDLPGTDAAATSALPSDRTVR